MNKQTHSISPALETQMANAIRALSMDAVQMANSGHPGMPMGMADVATVLFNRFVNVDPATPQWPDRDRFVLSAGHGSMLLYSLHHLLGYEDMDIEQLRSFRQLGSRTAGHPEYGHALGIETTTGPLGQGIATAVGMALGEKILRARHGEDVVDHWTYVIAGDGCLMEGISHEAIDLAGHQKLGKLIVLWDDNEITIDGATNLSTSMDQKARFKAAGWHVASVDGHDHTAIAEAIEAARQGDRPALIACKTIIGYGAPNKQGTAATHGAPLGDAEITAAREALGWPHAPFVVPDDLRAAWKSVATRGAAARKAWQARLDQSDTAGEFLAGQKGPNIAGLHRAINDHKAHISRDAPSVATRKASEMALEAVTAACPSMLGGSADLTGSNNTRTKAMQPVTADDASGSYMHYGIREHGMAAAMNGLALHGGFVPYGGTFLAFADYSRPAIRLGALMGVRSIHVMTHDSIGLGEDGPTHQPVEHLASLRAIPNLNVFRPADAVETAEAWELAVTSEKTPSVLCLSRQNLPTVRTAHSDENLTGKGAYLLRAPERRHVTLIATGSEVALALEAAELLKESRIEAAVVSAPCFELFARQDESYRQEVLGKAPRIGIEAAVADGWHRWLGHWSSFIGMEGFGASAPANQLYEYFSITPQKVVATAKTLISA
ncbi:transketolase [Roseibium sp.]|uniref:transketolase n=1 Tax=Roseibium sp. TaxID=1936156 RepID=UPI003A974728